MLLGAGADQVMGVELHPNSVSVLTELAFWKERIIYQTDMLSRERSQEGR